MDISPQNVRNADFQTVKRGLDPDEVRAFLNDVANELERAQNQSTAMEARARAAVARLQEISESTPSTDTPAPAAGSTDAAPGADITASVDQAETISRTLLLAQRTADQAIAEAEAEAARLRSEAESEATRTIESSQELTQRMIDEAREEARRTGEAERVQVESEVNALLARRDFLESDVDHLQTFLVDERNRLRDAATSILEVADRVPAGLGEVRRPLLSASDDETDTVADADDAGDDSTPVTGTESHGGAGRLGSGDSTRAADAGADSDADDADVAADRQAAETADGAHDGVQRVTETASTEEIARVDATRRGDSDTSGTTPSDSSGAETSSADTAASEPEPDDGDQLVIKTDIADEGPTRFSYDDRDR